MTKDLTEIKREEIKDLKNKEPKDQFERKFTAWRLSIRQDELKELEEENDGHTT